MSRTSTYVLNWKIDYDSAHIFTSEGATNKVLLTTKSRHEMMKENMNNISSIASSAKPVSGRRERLNIYPDHIA
jgi:hypothetical protein